MNGATIQEKPCPRCAIRRTVRYATASFCHNCHLLWSGAPGAAELLRRRPSSGFGAAEQSALAYMFTEAEAARLVIYRAAVRAGFYTDW